MRVRSFWVWLPVLIVPPVLFAIGFAFLESAALADPEGLTLSQLVVNIAHAWPPIVFLFGLVLGILIGILTTHFLWPWVPRQYRATCGQCGKTILLKQ